MNRQTKTTGWGFMLLMFALFIPFLLLAQTNAPPFDPNTAALPTDRSTFWEWGIALVSPILVWLFARFGPDVPVMVLPILAPIVGLGLGALMNWLGHANLGWVDMAKAGALSVFVRELTNQLVTKRVNGETVKTTAKLSAVLLCFTLMFTGCAKTLEPGGAYAPTIVTTNAAGGMETNAVSKPDMVLYLADAGYDFVNTTIMGASDFERDNRKMLWAISPTIKHKLDAVRPQIVTFQKQWAAARKVYIANPVPANADKMAAALSELRAISLSLSTAIPGRQ